MPKMRSQNAPQRIRKNSSTVFCSQELLVIFREITSALIGNKPKICVTQKKIFFRSEKFSNLTLFLFFLLFNDLLNYLNHIVALCFTFTIVKLSKDIQIKFLHCFQYSMNRSYRRNQEINFKIKIEDQAA